MNIGRRKILYLYPRFLAGSCRLLWSGRGSRCYGRSICNASTHYTDLSTADCNIFFLILIKLMILVEHKLLVELFPLYIYHCRQFIFFSVVQSSLFPSQNSPKEFISFSHRLCTRFLCLFPSHIFQSHVRMYPCDFIVMYTTKFTNRRN